MRKSKLVQFLVRGFSPRSYLQDFFAVADSFAGRPIFAEDANITEHSTPFTRDSTLLSGIKVLKSNVFGTKEES